MSKAERTRNFIIEKAAPIFNVKGVAGTSLTDMLEATGLTKGSIYGNFENKDEVALAAFDYNFGKVVAYIRQQMLLRHSTIEKLLVYPETYRNFHKLPFLNAGCPLLNAAMEVDDTHTLLAQKTREALAYWNRSVERMINDGIKNNEIRKNVNPAEFAALLITLVEGGIMQAKTSGKMSGLNHAMNHLEQLIRALST